MNQLILSHIALETQIHSQFESVLLILCNVIMVLLGIILIYKLFRQAEMKWTAIYFAIVLTVNYIVIAFYGGITELLG
ncbi:hypothetical protein [Neobacillus terrae]|uniref:hypothetical protein n=1 Tax=Neobacillus terrae TaxID=3034837 RepID=UPI00140CB7E1|nr:hypothetical protein [Neobacillus terrae]NHM30722.1 hypothetical protein [Neobacillus terrae]